ncbi:MAG: hypothetical protein AB4368_05555 [Xenococcaceae cyanobacterium]
MGAIVSCFGLLIGSLLLIIGSVIGDEVTSQSVKILGGLVIVFSFPLSPLIVKGAILAVFVFCWPFISDRISKSFYKSK